MATSGRCECSAIWQMQAVPDAYCLPDVRRWSSCCATLLSGVLVLGGAQWASVESDALQPTREWEVLRSAGLVAARTGCFYKPSKEEVSFRQAFC